MENQCSWREIIEYILAEGKSIHKSFSIRDQWCYLTDRNGNRYKLDHTSDLNRAKELVQKIQQTNRKPTTFNHSLN